MKKKYLVLALAGALVLSIGGTALAASNTEKSVPTPSDEGYTQMYNACNNYMSKQSKQDGGDTQGFRGMMNGTGASWMMNGARTGGMMI